MTAQPSKTRRDTQQPLEARVDLSSTDPAQVENAARVLDFLAAHEAKHGQNLEPNFYLAGSDAGDRVELSSGMHLVLKEVVQAMSQGRSVSILSNAEEITTQQAAELLGLSRPTVVSLIEKGELTATIPGRRRRKLLLADVLNYRESLRVRRDQFIEQSSADYDFTNEVQDSELVEILARARKSEHR